MIQQKKKPTTASHTQTNTHSLTQSSRQSASTHELRWTMCVQIMSTTYISL